MVNFCAFFAFTSFLCQTANNCNNSYWHAPVCKVFVQKYPCSIKCTCSDSSQYAALSHCY